LGGSHIDKRRQTDPLETMVATQRDFKRQQGSRTGEQGGLARASVRIARQPTDSPTRFLRLSAR
jgi:hypothetical protein